MERFPPDAVGRLPRQLVPSINISLAQMRLIFLGTLLRERDVARKQVGVHRRRPGGREERERKERGDQADHVSFSQIRGRRERRQLCRSSDVVQNNAEAQAQASV